jgi:small subunit ribosomal protein S6
LSKKFYESYIIIDGNLDDVAIAEIVSKYEAFFTKNDIEVIQINKVGRRRMAYAIKKKQNGFYICFEILVSAGLIPKLERAYQLDENVLRYLSIHVSEKTKQEKEDHFKNRALLEEARQAELQQNLAKEEAEKTKDLVSETVENQ